MKLWEEIEAAQKKIQKVIPRTPMIYSDTFSKLTGKEVFLKLENLQKTGSFKIRGAYYKLSQLTPLMRKRGVVAASAGNHAQGVALASSILGVHSTLVMPEGVSLAKQMATQAYGGEIVLFGQNTDESMGYAKKLATDGKSFIHPFDDEQVIAGQGTIGLEILKEVPEVETIIVPIGGGGLISGITAIVKKRRPGVKIVGVQAIHAPSAFYSLKRKKIVEVKVKPTLADGIALQRLGEITFPLIQEGVEEIVTVGENEIASAILMLMERKRIVAEGAGATPLAALLSRRLKSRSKGLAQTGRLVRMSILLRDIPGALAKLTSLVAEHQANILHILHERVAKDIPIGFSRVILVLETRGSDHIREIQQGLRAKGYSLQILS
jgi:threonine dehydratase